MIHGSDALHNSLASMTASKSECSRVRAGAEHAYVLVERGQGARGLEMIAPASHHLQGHHKLSQEGAQWLRTQGFSRGKGRRDFRCTLPSTTGHVELAGRIEEVLHRAYGVTVANLCAQVQHDDRVHPTNEEVVENMRRLASTRDHGDRLRMYNSLVNGTLLVPFSPDANESALDLPPRAGWGVANKSVWTGWAPGPAVEWEAHALQEPRASLGATMGGLTLPGGFFPAPCCSKAEGGGGGGGMK